MSKRFFAACWMIGLMMIGIAWQTTQAAEPAQAVVDAQSRKVIDTFAKYFKSLHAYGVEVFFDLTIEQGDQKQQQEITQRFLVERPNRLVFNQKTPTASIELVDDGKAVSISMRGADKYGAEKAPETLAQLAEHPIVQGVMAMGNAAPVTMALFSEDPATTMLAGATDVKYTGLVTLDKVPCHLIHVTGKEIDWDLWVDAGDKPLPRRMVPDLNGAFKKMAGADGKSPFEGLKATDIVTFNAWQIDPKFAADAFAFNVPPGADKVDSLMELFGQKEPGPSPLLGLDAPSMKLALLDGGNWEVASFKNKNVVILDFWATWCGPCVRAMPIIDSVAEEYKAKGVRLFAVNLMEDGATIRDFLKEAKLHPTVAMDAEGELAKAYLVEGIPQTVIVGKDGTVQVVRIGLSPKLEEELRKDLDALLEGKNLAKETLAKAKKK